MERTVLNRFHRSNRAPRMLSMLPKGRSDLQNEAAIERKSN